MEKNKMYGEKSTNKKVGKGEYFILKLLDKVRTM